MADDGANEPLERVAFGLAMHYVVRSFAGPGVLCCCDTHFEHWPAWRAHVAGAVLDALGLEPVAVMWPVGDEDEMRLGWLRPNDDIDSEDVLLYQLSAPIQEVRQKA